jgi:hypothetical protein
MYYFPEKPLPYGVYIPKNPNMKPGAGGLLDKLELWHYQYRVTVGFYALNDRESYIMNILLCLVSLFTARYMFSSFVYYVVSIYMFFSSFVWDQSL